MDTASLIVHVSAAAFFVGPQLLLFLAVVPSTWLIEDERLRRDVTRVVTRRYAMISGITFVVLLATGIYQFFAVVPEVVTANFGTFRWGRLFLLKMGLLTLLVLLTLYHAFAVGPRVRHIGERIIAGELEAGPELEAARRSSLLLSFGLFVLSLGVLGLGVTLGYHEYSYQRP